MKEEARERAEWCEQKACDNSNRKTFSTNKNDTSQRTPAGENM